MKELEIHTRIGNDNRVEMNVKKQQGIEKFLDGTLKPKRGHFVWEINELTLQVKRAEYKKNTVALNFMAETPPEELMKLPNCIYIPALNARNAMDKYNKNHNQSAYYSVPAPMKLSDLNFK